MRSFVHVNDEETESEAESSLDARVVETCVENVRESYPPKMTPQKKSIIYD
jgi:hypothetical protein